MSYFHTTTTGDHNGRASYYHRNKANAEARAEAQNAKAEALGVSARYTVAEFDGEPEQKREIRD